MSRFENANQNKAKSALIYLTPLVVYAFSLCGERIFAADAQKGAEGKPGAAVVGAATSNVQPVASGVKLLEGIFQKLRNQPQLAFSNSRAQNLLQAAGLAGSAGKNASSMTDQLLAIRPAERSIGSKSLHMDYSGANAIANNSDAFTSVGAPRSERRMKSASMVPPPPPKPLAESIQNLAGAAAALQGVTSGDNSTVQSYGGYAQGRGQVIANTPLITDYRDFSNQNQYGAAGINRQIQVPSPKAKKKTSYDEASKLAYAPAGAPTLQAATNGTVGPQGADATFVTGVSPASEPVAPASPGLFKNIREFNNKQERYANGSSGVKEMFDARKDEVAMDKRQIAMLPPSIVSGVPLVHLGASALQIKEALGGKVRIDKQNIEDWNVWSVFGKNKSECALQLYFKHGVVEAIRVFDAGYLGVDSGVKLGSDLQTIKEKFGEPAFILPEPAGGRSLEAGKNYIYPISQVSFALARSHDRAKPAPIVVSMLIFNVK